jgi:dolichol-phosphate mannosyltransferase
VLIDVVMAVRNEQDNIPVIASELRSRSLPGGVRLRMLFVEDNSTDGTLQALRRQASSHGDVRYYSIRNTHGQTAAIAFGLSRSDADAVIMMDADGGHPPTLVPEMAAQFLDGAEVAQAVRTSAAGRDTRRNTGTLLFQHVVRLITGFDAERQNVYFRLVSRHIAQRILRDNRTLYFLRLSFLNDVKTVYLRFDSPPRMRGQSKYNLKRLVRLSFDGLLSVMNVRRFLLWETLCLVPAALLAVRGWWLMAAICAVPAIVIGTRYAALSFANPVDDLEILEQG